MKKLVLAVAALVLLSGCASYRNMAIDRYSSANMRTFVVEREINESWSRNFLGNAMHLTLSGKGEWWKWRLKVRSNKTVLTLSIL